MQYLNEAIGLLMPGVRFRCMVAMGEKGELGRESLGLDGLSETALATVLAAEDGGAHNLALDSEPGAGRLALHWLRLADPLVVRPTDEAIAEMQTEVADMVAQAEAVRQRVYDGLVAPVVALAQGAGALGARRSLLTLTAKEATALERFERYMKQTVATDARVRLLEPLPAVEAAALVLPVTLHQDGLWIYGEDNRAAWHAYIDG